MMLTVKQLLRQTGQHRQVLISNSNKVSVSFNKPTVGKDSRGYFRRVMASARTNAAGKKTKRIELRFYWPKGRSKAEHYVPEELRKKELHGQPYLGPEEAPKFTTETPVWVSCSCAYFLFHCEVADAESDNSDIKYSNGKGPSITNPNHVAHLCKHLISALRKGALLKK